MLKLFTVIRAKSQALLKGEHQNAPEHAQEETAEHFAENKDNLRVNVSNTPKSARMPRKKARLRWTRIRERYDEVKATVYTMRHHSIPIMIQAAKEQVNGTAAAFHEKTVSPHVKRIQERSDEVKATAHTLHNHTIPVVMHTLATQFDEAATIFQEKNVAPFEHEIVKRYEQVSGKVQALTPDIASWVWGTSRVQQLSELQSEQERSAQSIAKRDAREYMLVSAASLTTAAIGVFGFPFFLSLGALGLVYTGLPLCKKALKQIFEDRKLTVDSLGTITWAVCTLNAYWVIGNLTVAFYHLSKVLLLKVHDESRKQISDVFRQHPSSVWILVNEQELEIPFERLKVGDIAIVNTGEIIPADGSIQDGLALVDEHILTGEAQPVDKAVGDNVFASTVVLAGRIRIQVEQAGETTIVSKIADILNNTADYKTTTMSRAERFADRTVWPTILLSAVTVPFFGLYSAAAFISAHFKYRPSIVASTSILNFLNLFSKHGILVKDGRILDMLNKVDTLVFDKTGTLTQDMPHVGQIHPCSTYHEYEVLQYAAAAEQRQSHPIARAILQETEARRLAIPSIDDAEYRVGYGLTVKLDDQRVRVGSARFMEITGISIPPDIAELQTFCHDMGYSLVMVAVNEQVVGAIELHETLVPGIHRILDDVRQYRNIKAIHLISGDHEIPTRRLSQQLGIDTYFAEVLPEDKAALIAQLQQDGKFVCYVGDGINDAIALKQAQVSVSLRGASTVAKDAAQIILMDGYLHQLIPLFELARSFKRNMDVCLLMVTVPMVSGMAGVFILNVGLLYTISLNVLGLSAGMVSAMLPLFHSRQKTLPADVVYAENKEPDEI